ncbi:MAG: hypothetical protein H0V29_00930 [Thermoleophilaceae bacterium]|nr:hypothetical protein [Thermoleophilaceae bacterium]
MSKPLLVVDAPSLLYRSFHALPKSITDDDGQPVNALLGTANQILRVVADHDPRAVVLCFGLDAATYRVELLPAYHADRPPVPDELGPQFLDSPAFFGAFGWTSEATDTHEADDLLGSYTLVEEKAGGTVRLLTGDRDMFQCASKQTKVLYVKPGGPEVMGPAEVKKRYGVTPAQVPDFIALRGDPSDGIPGAKGIGEKTAAELLRKHGTLERAIADGGPKITEHLLDYKEMATLAHLKVKRPKDSPLDREGAAKAAEARGMNRLAERLRSGG